MRDPKTGLAMAFAAALATTIPMAALTQALAAAQPAPLSSEELAKQPQTPGAVGDQQRHYWFEAAKTEMPYRLYVPKAYDGKTRLPVIVALHGAGGNQNYFFRDTYGMAALMEKHGFIFVEPLGFHSFGGYGAGALPRVPVALDPGVEPNPVNARRPQWTAAETAKVNQLSEQDVLNVLAIVQKEYAVDASRIYLMGHSMGGMGTWYLAQKYPEKWAAIGAMSGGFGYADYPLERLKGIPIIATAGGKDTAMHGPQAQAEYARFKRAGLNVTYVEVPDGTHMSNIPTSFPQVIAFLAAQPARK